MKKIELLSPAGDYNSFLAAISCGADAVYLSGDKFGARAYAKNFSKEELIKCISSEVPTEQNADFLRNFPTALWIEQNIALYYNETERRFFRGKPVSIKEIASKLAEYVGLSDEDVCQDHIIKVLNWCNNLNVEHKTNLLPYKIHQFIPQTGKAYAT